MWFAWSGDPQRDRERIEAALAELRDRLKPVQGKIMLFGFSSGAVIAVEIAARDPERFAGALVMSPGGFEPATGKLAPSDSHGRQGYVMVCGADENPGNVEKAAVYARDMERLGARVFHHAYPDVSQHALAPDFQEQLPAWIGFMLDPTKRVPAS
jgi:predicted esterase